MWPSFRRVEPELPGSPDVRSAALFADARPFHRAPPAVRHGVQRQTHRHLGYVSSNCAVYVAVRNGDVPVEWCACLVVRGCWLDAGTRIG